VKALLALLIRTSQIVRIDLADGSVHGVTDDTGSAPDGVVVEGDTVYWTTMGKPIVNPDIPGEKGRDYSRKNGGVHGLKLDGSAKFDVVPVGGVTTGKQLASDGAGTLYWGDREGCKVSRVRVDGSRLEDVVVNPHDGLTEECVGVAVDRERGHFYWTQKGPAKGGQGRILRAGINLPAGETVESRSDIEVLWANLPEPIDLHIEGDRLYWTDRGAPPDGNTLNRAPIPGHGERGAEPEILASGFREAIGLCVSEKLGLAWVSALGGDIREVPLPDGPAAGRGERILASFGAPVTGLAAL
jgi:hypothetical protein